MSKTKMLDVKDFLSLVGKIYALQDVKTAWGRANLMTASKLVYNQLLHDGLDSGRDELLPYEEFPEEGVFDRRYLDYPALPQSLNMPVVWTDTDPVTLDDLKEEAKREADKTKKRRSDDSPKKISKKPQ